MKNRLLPLASMLFLLPLASGTASETGSEIIAEVELGMTEEDVQGQYPDGSVSVDDIEMIFEGRYGDFRRGGKEYKNGLTMFKLRPTGLDSRAECKSFFDTIKPRLSGHHGDPVSESAKDEPDLGAWQASWQAPGLSIRIESVWYEEQKTCAAEVFVRPTDIEPL